MLLLYSPVLLSYGSLGTTAPAVHHTGPLAGHLVQTAGWSRLNAGGEVPALCKVLYAVEIQL